MSEMQQAMERLKKSNILEVIRTSLNKWRSWYPSEESIVEVPRADLLALKAIADAFIALQLTPAEVEMVERLRAESDDGPVTVEFVESIATGPMIDGKIHCWWYLGQVAFGCCVSSFRMVNDCPDDADSIWIFEAVSHDVDEEPNWDGRYGLHVATRGQVITLMSALDITPKGTK